MRAFPLLVLLTAASAPFQVDAADAERFPTALSLVRYDTPIGLSDGFAPTRQPAVRRADGDEALDWPEMTLNGAPIFRGGAEDSAKLKLHRGAEADSPFESRTDDIVEPGGHWLRAIETRFGRRCLYTADRFARTGTGEDNEAGRYEIWTFPVKIEAEGAPAVKNVVLKSGGKVIYKKAGPLRVLTLLLPAGNYEVSVNSRPSLPFSAGLLPGKLGSPTDRPIAIDAEIAGEGPRIRLQSVVRPEVFPNPEAWAADCLALTESSPIRSPRTRPKGMRRWLGVEAPASPMSIYAMELPRGLSGGFEQQGATGFAGDYGAYCEHLASLGFTTVFEQANDLAPAESAASVEAHCALMAGSGMKLGLVYDNNLARPSLDHPNAAFLSHALAEWHGPLYRSLSLAAQRFSKRPNFAGFSIGSGDAGYASFGRWNTPAPNHVWGEAMIDFMGSAEPGVPRLPSMASAERSFEYACASVAEFTRYVSRYDATYQQYGYFAEAVRHVDSALVFTTASYGSSPGAGGRGGWPWASIPARPMFEGLNVQQAYDWNEKHAALPMHLEALTDRLRSYWPEKRTWSLVDNAHLLYGREAWQRACALALTRGIEAIGTNWLPKADGEGARPDAVSYIAEMNAWIRTYGGVYAHTEPQPVIGIFYGHHQAVQRRVITAENPARDAVYAGSHEGKVTEALFLCHAAGLPARVITYQEVMRGPLPESMKAMLLVGLDRADNSWTWSPGLDRPLQQFLDQGGRILADDDSFCPVACIRPGLRVAAYQPASDFDPTPLLLARNSRNMDRLKQAMEDVAPAAARSGDPAIWIVPTICGDVQYVTVINQGVVEGKEAREMLRPPDRKAVDREVWKTKGNASLFVKPQKGTLTWDTDRPVYDVRKCMKLSEEEMSEVDLTSDSFQWYALPPAEMTKPKIETTKDFSRFYQATVAIGASGSPMSGIPFKIEVSRGGESAVLYGASGFPLRLPLHEDDAPGEYRIAATELLSGLRSETVLNLAAPVKSRPGRTIASSVRMSDSAAVAKFASRKETPLVIGLTAGQASDEQIVQAAAALRQFYRKSGRSVSQRLVESGDIVESLQPVRCPSRYPQWKTIPADLVLFGLRSDNVLIRDQERAEIFPAAFHAPAAGTAEVVYARSPFVGEFDVLNIIAPDRDGIREAVRALTK